MAETTIAADTEIAPFRRHQRVAETLLRTLEQALAPQFQRGQALRRDDLARAVELIIAHGDSLTPLFAQICRSCVVDGHVAVVERLARRAIDRRRRDHLTRLLFSAISRTVPKEVDPLTGAEFPRVMVGGLQSNLANLFYDRELEAMNADAGLVFEKAGTDSDEELWPRLSGDTTLPVVADAVFIRVLLRFKQFSYQRRRFVDQLSRYLKDANYAFTFTDAHFVTVFDGMFGRLRDGLGSELGRARLDTRYGDETAAQMLRVFDEFDRHRQELEGAAKSLMGPQKLMRARPDPGANRRGGVGR